MQPTFVVGTGRCGSTMLSNMLRRHERILSISECFSFTCDLGGRIPAIFPSEPIDGAHFYNLIAALGPRSQLMLRHDIAMPEVLYDFKSANTRYSAAAGVPAFSQVVLPHISDEPDTLLDELRAELLDRPEAPIRAHYQHAFEWLTRRHGKSVWIERTGGAFVIIEPIHATFPDARYIHIVRDGRDTALSISEHLGFRMFLIGSMLTEMLGFDPYETTTRANIDRLPPEMRAFLPESFDADAFRQYRVPLAMCGGLWSQQIQNGMGVLGGLPAERVLTLRYEDFFARPEEQLDRLAAFVGDEFVDDTWATECAAMVRQPTSSWRTLAADDQAALDAACRPGFELLRAAGIEYS